MCLSISFFLFINTYLYYFSINSSRCMNNEHKDHKISLPNGQSKRFLIFLIVTPCLGAYLIGLTIQMANQIGFYLFNHHPLLGCLLDWSYNPNGQSNRFLSFQSSPLLGCLLDWSYNPNGQLNRFFILFFWYGLAIVG